MKKKAVRIVGDAAVATKGTGDGRLIPLLILDSRERADIPRLIGASENFDSGDVVIQWGSLPNRHDSLALILHFIQPVERTLVIEFDLQTQGVLVEHILCARAVYLQAGEPGDRLVHNLNKHKLLTEVPDTGFRPYWDKYFLSMVTRQMRQDGMKRKDAKSAARLFIQALRDTSKLRA